MTREERHIAVLNRMLESMDVYDSIQPTTERKKAIKAAIKALSQEPTEKPMCDRNICISNEYNGIGCDECIVNKAEQEPCDDAISREAAINMLAGMIKDRQVYFGHHGEIEYSCGFSTFKFYIEQLPSVTQKSGKWIKVKSGDKDFPESIVCSRCNNENSHLDFNENAEPIGKVFVTSKYCPNCGAKMESEDKK